MIDLSFSQLIEVVKQTLLQLSYEYNFNFDTVRDNLSCYRVVINFNNCMGEILINNEEFVPYRYVQVEILSFDSKSFHQVYYWGDSQDDDLQSIIYHIKEGVQTGIQF